jgi:hypothetical protein
MSKSETQYVAGDSTPDSCATEPAEATTDPLATAVQPDPAGVPTATPSGAPAGVVDVSVTSTSPDAATVKACVSDDLTGTVPLKVSVVFVAVGVVDDALVVDLVQATRLTAARRAATHLVTSAAPKSRS